MEAGRLKHIISLEKPSTALDDFGHTAGWDVVRAEVFAEVRGVGARERLRGAGNSATFTHTVLVRYDPAIPQTPDVSTWRVRWGNRLLNIIGVTPYDATDQWLILDCDEGSVDGQ